MAWAITIDYFDRHLEGKKLRRVEWGSEEAMLKRAVDEALTRLGLQHAEDGSYQITASSAQ